MANNYFQLKRSETKLLISLHLPNLLLSLLLPSQEMDIYLIAQVTVSIVILEFPLSHLTPNPLADVFSSTFKNIQKLTFFSIPLLVPPCCKPPLFPA